MWTTVSDGKAGVRVLRRVGFDLHAGEIVGILGESGAGKSTLALSLLGLLPANARVEGSVLCKGEDLLHPPESRWKAVRGAAITMIFQEPGASFSPVLRVGDQIADVIRAHQPGTRKDCELKAKAILKQARLTEVERIYAAYPHQLSAGQLHRAAIARALACQPALLIADEPTRSLDPPLQNEITTLLREVSRELGFALIFITHNPALLAVLADRVLVIYAGCIVEDGPVSQVFRRPHHTYTQRLLQLARRISAPENCGSSKPGELVPEPGGQVDCFDHLN